MIVLPGGMPGADHLKRDPRVISLLRQFAQTGRYTAAICAAPGVLAHAGLLDGPRGHQLPGLPARRFGPRHPPARATPVVVDGKVVTSRGPGTAMEFALALIELLEGPEARRKVQERLQMTRG